MCSDSERAALQKWLEQALADIMNHPSAWPFLKPVDATEVSDYYSVIKDPIGRQSTIISYHLFIIFRFANNIRKIGRKALLHCQGNILRRSSPYVC